MLMLVSAAAAVFPVNLGRDAVAGDDFWIRWRRRRRKQRRQEEEESKVSPGGPLYYLKKEEPKAAGARP